MEQKKAVEVTKTGSDTIHLIRPGVWARESGGVVVIGVKEPIMDRLESVILSVEDLFALVDSIKSAQEAR